jgi:hypothetical protein
MHDETALRPRRIQWVDAGGGGLRETRAVRTAGKLAPEGASQQQRSPPSWRDVRVWRGACGAHARALVPSACCCHFRFFRWGSERQSVESAAGQGSAAGQIVLACCLPLPSPPLPSRTCPVHLFVELALGGTDKQAATSS